MTTLDSLGEPTADTASPACETERTENTERAFELIKNLPGKEREIVRLKFQNGLSYREIAQVTDLSISHVGVLLHNALKRLRAEMNEA